MRRVGAPKQLAHADNPGMSNAHPQFGETLHDWQADPSNWRAGTLFQPKSLGLHLPSGRAARRARRVVTWLMTAIAASAGLVAGLAVARLLHWL